MSDSQQQRCAARGGSGACQTSGTHEHLETHDVHERRWFYLCDLHEEAWRAGHLSLERLDPLRVVSYVE